MPQDDHYPKETIRKFAAGALTPLEALDVERHLNACDACSAVLGEQPLKADPFVRGLRRLTGRDSSIQDRRGQALMSLEVVWGAGAVVFRSVLYRPVEVGRQSEGEPVCLGYTESSPFDRLVVAPADYRFISRRHVFLQPTSAKKVNITCLTEKGLIEISGGRRIPFGQSIECQIPVEISLGQHSLRISRITIPEGPATPGESGAS